MTEQNEDIQIVKYFRPGKNCPNRDLCELSCRQELLFTVRNQEVLAEPDDDEVYYRAERERTKLIPTCHSSRVAERELGGTLHMLSRIGAVLSARQQIYNQLKEE